MSMIMSCTMLNGPYSQHDSALPSLVEVREAEAAKIREKHPDRVPVSYT